VSDERSEVFGGISCCITLFGVCDDYYLLKKKERERRVGGWYLVVRSGLFILGEGNIFS
jgi:hypothetical protein